jgi:hypothetical protein
MDELSQEFALDQVSKPAQPKYDNFFSPRNQGFYSQFHYADLNQDEPHIFGNSESSHVVLMMTQRLLPLNATFRKILPSAP